MYIYLSQQETFAMDSNCEGEPLDMKYINANNECNLPVLAPTSAMTGDSPLFSTEFYQATCDSTTLDFTKHDCQFGTWVMLDCGNLKE